MKKIINICSFLALNLATIISHANINSTCLIVVYEPKVPEVLLNKKV